MVAGRGGALRSAGLEAPFVGRDRELRLVKELFHASAEERRAQLVSVTAIAGIGKSRLAWEFEKYIDGLRGRRSGIAAAASPTARASRTGRSPRWCACAAASPRTRTPSRRAAKLRAALEEYVPDDRGARLGRPRSGAPARARGRRCRGDEENLFSAWRILFERLAETIPTVLVFEDMQWADAGLLDFIEYLLDWSRSQPLFVLALARPEFAERRPDWGAGKRSFTSLYLEPLSADGDGRAAHRARPRAAGRPARARILDRAEGVPLYAVETVRMLLDRGLLVAGRATSTGRPGRSRRSRCRRRCTRSSRPASTGWRPRSAAWSRTARCSARRSRKQGLAAVTGSPEAELEPLLARLLRKEVLSVQADPRSPERGQYAFLQDIVKRVAYETISRRERKAKHLAAAEFLLSLPGSDEDEIVEVVAAHYLDALDAAPDATTPRRFATGPARCSCVRRPGRFARRPPPRRSAPSSAQPSSSDDPLAQAELHERAGIMARTGARGEEARVALRARDRAVREVGRDGTPRPGWRRAWPR